MLDIHIAEDLEASETDKSGLSRLLIVYELPRQRNKQADMSVNLEIDQ